MSLLHLLLFTGRSLVVLDFADFGGLERFAVAVVVVCRRLQADELSVMFCVIFGSVGWRVDVNSESEHSPSTEVSSTAANRINLCTGLSITLLLPSSVVR